jgi:hypothetical protein
VACCSRCGLCSRLWRVVAFVTLYLKSSGFCEVFLKLVTREIAPSLYGFSDHPQGRPLVDRGFPFWWESLKENTVAFVAYGACASTPLQWRVASARVWTSRYIIDSLCLGYFSNRSSLLIHFTFWYHSCLMFYILLSPCCLSCLG